MQTGDAQRLQLLLELFNAALHEAGMRGGQGAGVVAMRCLGLAKFIHPQAGHLNGGFCRKRLTAIEPVLAAACLIGAEHALHQRGRQGG